MIKEFRSSTVASPVILLAIIAATLLGCASSRLSSDVKPYVGRNIHELVVHLGNPTGKLENSGDRVFVWSSDSEGVLPTGSGAGGVATSLMTVHHECTLDVTIDAANVILSYQIEGSDAGCASFRDHFWH
jgi:hypothetical protein